LKREEQVGSRTIGCAVLVSVLFQSSADGGSQPVRRPKGTTYAGSSWLTPSRFLALLKNVAVTLDVHPSVLQHVPAAAVRSMLARELAARGIVDQPAAPVRLRAQIVHRRATFTTQRVSTKSGQPIRSPLEEPVQHLMVWLRFELTTAVLRQDTFHVLNVIPADGYSLRGWSQERESPAERLAAQLEQGFREALTSVADNDEPAEPPHWRASAWSPPAAAEIHSGFVAALKNGAREPRTFRDVNVRPELSVVVGESARRFMSRREVEDKWEAQFRHLGLQQQPVTGLYIEHRIYALNDDASTAARVWGVQGMPFLHLSQVLLLLEKDVVYRLDGVYYRSDVQVRAWAKTGFSLPADTKQALDEQVAAAIDEFGREFRSLR
jgi:hypothetical protein